MVNSKLRGVVFDGRVPPPVELPADKHALLLENDSGNRAHVVKHTMHVGCDLLAEPTTSRQHQVEHGDGRAVVVAKPLPRLRAIIDERATIDRLENDSGDRVEAGRDHAVTAW